MNIIDTCSMCNSEFEYILPLTESGKNNLNEYNLSKFELKICNKKHRFCELCIDVLNRQYTISKNKNICPSCNFINNKNKIISFFNYNK